MHADQFLSESIVTFSPAVVYVFRDGQGGRIWTEKAYHPDNSSCFKFSGIHIQHQITSPKTSDCTFSFVFCVRFCRNMKGNTLRRPLTTSTTLYLMIQNEQCLSNFQGICQNFIKIDGTLRNYSINGSTKT